MQYIGLPINGNDMLDSHQLHICLMEAELENFSEAGRHLNLFQPSVSAHIQSLARHYNTQLFHRSGRHISLTESGEALFPLARAMVRLSVHIEESMASLGDSVVGQLRLGRSTAVGKYTLPRLIAFSVGAFTLCGIIVIFNQGRCRSVERLVVLTGWLGYARY